MNDITPTPENSEPPKSEENLTPLPAEAVTPITEAIFGELPEDEPEEGGPFSAEVHRYLTDSEEDLRGVVSAERAGSEGGVTPFTELSSETEPAHDAAVVVRGAPEAAAVTVGAEEMGAVTSCGCVEVDTTKPHALWYAAWVLLAALAAFEAYYLFQNYPLDAKMAPSVTPPVELRFLGRLHPLILHLPIGVILLAGIWEMTVWGKHRKSAQVTVTSMLWVAALACMASVASGWFLAQEGGYQPSLLEPHFTFALFFTAGVFLTLLLKLASRSTSSKVLSFLSTLALLGSLGCLSYSAHQGGGLSHGEKFMAAQFPPHWREFVPVSMQNFIGLETPTDLTQVVPSPENPQVNTPAKDSIYAEIIQPILDAKCVVCHGPDKTKGDLQMDTLEHLLAGGESTSPPTLSPSKPADSLMLILMKLPIDDEDRMPPETKAQPSAEEIQAIEWWIANGATAALGMEDVPVDDPIRPILLALRAAPKPGTAEITPIPETITPPPAVVPPAPVVEPPVVPETITPPPAVVPPAPVVEPPVVPETITPPPAVLELPSTPEPVVIPPAVEVSPAVPQPPLA